MVAKAEGGDLPTSAGAGDGDAGDRTDYRQFAVVNASELLERLAYYGVLSVTALYLAQEGYSVAVIGALFSLLLPLPYVIPLVAAPLAARFGYRPVMLVAFAAYASGFLVIFASPALAPSILGIVLVGVGAGLFKPLTAAAIGLVTSTRQRSFGYSVYYVGINIGGFVGPILIALLGEYRLAYLVGAGTIALDALLVFLLFRNPLEPKPGLGLFDAVRPFKEVLTNGRFLVLLAIFSGFWMLYSMNFSFVILYLQDFVARPGWFKPGLQVSLESLCVIVLGVPLGALATRMDAVKTMALGIGLLVIGFLVVGFFPVLWLFILGIVLVAAGEVLAYPGFLSYVSRIAPPDRIAVYQGVGFLPLFVGFLIGPFLGGQLYGPLADNGTRPALFWALVCGLGVIALAALLVYARAIRLKDAAKAPRWQGKPAAAVVLLLGIAAIVAASATGSRIGLPPDQDEVDPLDPGFVILEQDGTLDEGSRQEIVVAIPPGADNVTFTLSWTDEAAASPLPGAQNQPDTFSLEVADRFGTRLGRESATDTQGEVTLRLVSTAAGDLTVRITLDAAGDTVVLGQTAAADTSNEWSLAVAVA